MWTSTRFPAYAVQSSPFLPNFMSVACAQYFGVVGNGEQVVVERTADGEERRVAWLTREACYDTAWSECNEHLLASAQADGGVYLYDVNNVEGPVARLGGHTAEVVSVDWNGLDTARLASASWDRAVRVWDAVAGAEVAVLPDLHGAVTYAAAWHPRNAAQLASVGGDCMCNILDLNVPGSVVHQFPAHDFEVLTVDWHKYDPNLVATGSVDKTVRLWDLRNLGAGPVLQFHGHQLAARAVRCHPHNAQQVVSVSYDMTCIVWDLQLRQPVQSFDHHSEFVTGLDLSLFEPGLVSTASWDRTICQWNHIGGAPGRKPPELAVGAGPR